MLIKDIDVVILCGGFGERLKSVTLERPKILAKVGDTTFLDILIDKISQYKFKNIILCTGYLKGHIKKHFDDCHNKYNITLSEEETPLGTGGATKNAKSLIKSEQFIVMNGDSICNINFNEFLKFHIKNNGLISIVLSKSEYIQDYGSVTIDESYKITSFNEKIIKKESINKLLINAGIYLMKMEIFNYMPKSDNFSLEYDLFPKLCGNDCNNEYNSKCYGFITNNEVIDIGTPERYKKYINTINR